MGFGRRGGRCFKEKFSVCQKGSICRGWQWPTPKMAWVKNEPRQAECACRGCDKKRCDAGLLEPCAVFGGCDIGFFFEEADKTGVVAEIHHFCYLT